MEEPAKPAKPETTLDAFAALGAATGAFWEALAATFTPVLDFMNRFASLFAPAPKPPKRKPLIHNGRKPRK